MIYFDNAATGGRKPDTVLTAVTSAIKICANPGRSGHKLALSCAKLVQDCRNTLNNFFDGFGFERIIFTKNCTEALNIALFGVLQKGDHVIATCMEHNSVLRPLEYLQKAGVITYDICGLTDGNISPQSVQALLKPNTRLVAVTTASNVTGATPPIKEIRSILPEPVLLLCDGAQGAGHLDIKMKGAGIDLLTLAGHKGILGIQGSGALLFSDRVEPRPLLFGGTGSVSTSLDMPDFYPDALEAGTLSFPAIVSMLEGIHYLTIHQKEIEKQLLFRTDYFLKNIRKLKDYTVFSSPNPCGIISLQHSRMQSEYVAEILSARYAIAVRGGLHCAPLIHEALNTSDGGLVRISLSHYNTKNELDILLQALNEINNM